MFVNSMYRSEPRLFTKAIDYMPAVKLIAVRNDFCYINGIKIIVNKGEEFFGIQRYPEKDCKTFILYDIFTLEGKYLSIFGRSTFKLIEFINNENFLKSLEREKQINSILND